MKEKVLGNWLIKESDHVAFPGHRRGTLYNRKTNTKYVWNIIKGELMFYRIPKAVNNIPISVERIILDES